MPNGCFATVLLSKLLMAFYLEIQTMKHNYDELAYPLLKGNQVEQR